MLALAFIWPRIIIDIFTLRLGRLSRSMRVRVLEKEKRKRKRKKGRRKGINVMSNAFKNYTSFF